MAKTQHRSHQRGLLDTSRSPADDGQRSSSEKRSWATRVRLRTFAESSTLTTPSEQIAESCRGQQCFNGASAVRGERMHYMRVPVGLIQTRRSARRFTPLSNAGRPRYAASSAAGLRSKRRSGRSVCWQESRLVHAALMAVRSAASPDGTNIPAAAIRQMVARTSSALSLAD